MLKVPNTKANMTVKKAIDSMALEGMTFDEEFIKKMLDVANGKMTADELIEEIKQEHGVKPSKMKCRTWEDYKNYVKALDMEDRMNMEEMEDTAEFIYSLIERRRELKLTQRELAKRCGISKQTIRRLESFQHLPKLDSLMKIVRGLDLKLQVSVRSK